MKNRGLIATIVVLVAVIIALIAVLILMQMPTIISSDTIRNNFFNREAETSITSTIETSEKEVETTEKVRKMTTKVDTYEAHNGRVNIDYPQIVGMKDIDKQDKINNKIKTNALSIVPLYPISTALQRLNISCEVKYLDDKYITIIYEGRVVGTSVKSGGSSSSSGSGSGRSSSVTDPYLDGFVDPLTTFGQYQYSVPPTAAYNYSLPETARRSGGVEITYNGQNARSNSKVANDVSTSDSGPTVTDIKAPTAKPRETFAVENSASNYPNANVSSNVINPNNISSNGVYSHTQTDNIIPADFSNVDTYSVSVYGFTNTSASTIDQRIYYTNTIDLETGLDMRLKDYVSDFSALSKYLRSSKVEFSNIDSSKRSEVRTYINKTIQSKYIEQMENADFRNEGVTSWPKIFSYKDSDGTVYFSVKLSSKLGNYAIVKYNN